MTRFPPLKQALRIGRFAAWNVNISFHKFWYFETVGGQQKLIRLWNNLRVSLRLSDYD